MEIRKDSLSSVKLCRFCLSKDSQDLRSLYDRSSGRARNNASLSMKILSAMAVEVFPSDKMPSYICGRCNYFMDICYEYKQICRQADESILQYVQTGFSLKPIPWPAVLTKAHQLTKPNSMGVVKTVVEGGATVEVSSQDMSDEDGEDDENVYKVKIGDGKEEARIKVITSDESKKPRKGSEVCVYDADCGLAVPRVLTDGCWACDECDCSYPLQQLLELHKMQKHRARTVSCNQCDAQFFTKYDLAVHRVRHSNETPFECTTCDRKFKRFTLLKRHERQLHSDLQRMKCTVPGCRRVTFHTTEDWNAHSKIHNRGFPCDQCGKKFCELSTLHRHKMTIHTTVGKSWSCQYCPERLASVTKLARHVRTHAGERPYPCKYCDKSFTKSHHYTRHVRVKHSDVLSSDSFRCEQCSESFRSQDDLMYHSAIHATQDLTCPLCHEKFEDVDSVTTHIKSHVSGMEFMCEYCELVFTCKQKLDLHMIAAHEDEAQNDQSLGQDVDESSMEVDQDQEEDDDNEINVKEEGDHMVVEIKKAGSFILSDSKGEIDYRAETDNTCSEESETETTYPEMATLNTVSVTATPVVKASPIKMAPSLEPKPVTVALEKINDSRTAAILRKADEMKKKLQQKQNATITSAVKKEEKPVAKVEPNNSVGNDKSLKLLEKELQELQRTNVRQEASKIPAKPADPARNNRRPQLNTPTPKMRPTIEKKLIVTPKTPLEKKIPERRAIKENKEPKEAKTPVIMKEEKEKANDTSVKEDRDKDIKEKETPKSAVKNGTNEKSAEEVRRSSRPSKVKDYAKMAQHRVKNDSENDDSDDGDDEEYISEDARPKTRRGSGVKPQPKTPASKITPKKRGRPRKDQPSEVPAKISKQPNQDEEEENCEKEETEESSKEPAPIAKVTATTVDQAKSVNTDTSEQANTDQKPEVLKSPLGQTLKKVPVKSLPPGIKPLPLPSHIRPMGSGNISEMQIGKKMVKVQKIVMTKAEVEAMAKKGLLEMKDGTMVLKQGIKLPTSDANSIKSTLVGEESPTKKEKSAPTRCEMDENA